MPSKYEAPERKRTYGASPETKGAGYRAGPKRWTARGPAPARHIPWPEIFKHHISLVEGHLKMVDMVRKHTVEGTGNWSMISQVVDRAREMLFESKRQARDFNPPPRQREQVPLGSSSASMYPGYSPADHEYGKAAEEYGLVASEMRKQGIEPELGGMEYQLGQARGTKRKTLAEMKRREQIENAGESSSGSGSGSGSDGPVRKQKETNGNEATEAPIGTAEKDSAQAMDAPAGAEGELFFVDTKPTPVNLSDVVHRQPKRSITPEPAEVKKNKKAKKKHNAELAAGEGFEDIDEEVAARLKEKEEKKKGKEEKKRKRESNDSTGAQADGVASATATVSPAKPKKKKKKKSTEEAPVTEEVITKKRGAEGEADAGADADAEGNAGEGKKKAKKRGKKRKGDEEDI